ncbi:hypothetical protein MUP35_00865, partial [Patescibacteria group bacterium]|nr:hypothetical protein [Patescibacteria group bacterium]
MIAVVLGTGGFVVKNRINNQKVTNMVLEKKQEQKTQLQPSPIPTPTQESLYSVEIKSPPTLNSYGFTYKATLKNILVTPFITNFGFFECNFADENGNKYSGMLFDGNTFEKAILPNESIEFTVKDVRTDISGMKHGVEGFQKCSYNEKGENDCKLVNDLKIVDCIGYISTD